jgi:O-antigen/teichoic acid export membrane protein
VARVVTQAVFTIGGTLAQGIARIAIPILVGNVAGKSSLGTVSFVLSVCVLLSMVWPAPAGTAASRYAVDASAASNSALRSLRSSTLIALAVVALASGIIVGSQTSSVPLALLAALVTASYSAYFFTRGVFLGRFRARRLAAWEITGAVVAIGGTLASLAANAWFGALLALAIGYILIAIAGWPRHTGERTALNRAVLFFTAQNAVANAASNGMVQLTMVIVFAMTSPVQAGIFAAAFSLATPASLFGQTINQVLIPHLVDDAREGTPRIAPLAVGYLKLVGVTVVPFALIFVLSPLIVRVLYPDYAAATGLLQSLVLAMFFFTIALYPAAALTAWGHARALVWVNGIALLVGVAAMIVLARLSGGSGAALGLLVGTIVLAILTTITTSRVTVRQSESSS